MAVGVGNFNLLAILVATGVTDDIFLPLFSYNINNVNQPRSVI